MDRHVTSRPPRHSTDESPTPKITGSLAIADGLQRECLDLAAALEAAALEGARLQGRPDLARRRVAMLLRALAARVRSWHAARDARTSPADREQDYQDAATWLAEGRALMPQGGAT
jgi:hypothetical protein